MGSYAIWLVFCALLLVPAISGAATVSRAVALPLKTVQALAEAGNFKDAFARVDEAAAAAKTDDELRIVAQMRRYVEVRSTQAEQSGQFPDIVAKADRPTALPVIQSLVNAYNAKNYPGVIAIRDRLEKVGGMTKGWAAKIALAYFFNGDYANARSLAQKIVDVTTKDGRTAPNDAYAVLNTLQKNTPQQLAKQQARRETAEAVARGPENISESFAQNVAAGVAKYASWRAIAVTFNNNMSFDRGYYHLVWSETPSSIVAAQEVRNARMNSNFSWRDWNASILNGPNNPDNRWQIECIFPASDGPRLSAISKGALQTVQAKINSTNGHAIALDCHL
jgi:hypothetical protein